MSDAERRLWYHLRAHRFAGHKFKRQVPIGACVIDFACLNRMLILEIDGGQHAGNAKDRKRDAWLRARGFQVRRFWNNDVLRNTNAVLDLIIMALEERPSPGARSLSSGRPLRAGPVGAPPSPQGGEGKNRRQTRSENVRH